MPFTTAAGGRSNGAFTAFKTLNADGALLGPWGVFIQEPQVGTAHYDLVDAITKLKKLSDAAKQVAILSVGARFKAAYELYAHAAVAGSAGLSPAKVATLSAGVRPPDLTPDEACAFDVTAALLDGGVLPGSTYQAARQRLGPTGFERTRFLGGIVCSGLDHSQRF